MRNRLLLAGGAVIVAVGLGVGLGVGLSGGSGTAPTSGTATSTSAATGAGTSSSDELASIRAACEDWLHAAPQATGSAQWCSDMTKWMSTYMDRYGVGPQMMWGEPGRLSAECDRWMAASPPPGSPTHPEQWCTSMVTWMTRNMERWSHHGDWGEWMRYGPGPMGPGYMMGGS